MPSRPSPSALPRANITQLPNELLLEIFFCCARLFPSPFLFLCVLGAVSKKWRLVFESYENILWRAATFSAFPSISLSGQLNTSDDSSVDTFWRETFLIHWGWKSRHSRSSIITPKSSAAMTTVIVTAPPPTAVAMSPRLLTFQDSDSSFPQVTILSESTPDLAMSTREISSVQTTSMGLEGVQISQRYYSHHHPHEHHRIGPDHDHSILVDLHHHHQQPLQSEINQGGTKGDQGGNVCANRPMTQPPSVPPCSIAPTLKINEGGEILSCSLCTYSDICLIPQAKICIRTHPSRHGMPLMQVLDWSMQHSINVGRFRQVDQVNDGGNDGPDEENLVGMDENVYEHEMGTGAEDGSHGWDDDETRGESFLADGHQDLISGMDVNQAGTLLASCSIDGTVRVWDVLVHEFGGVATERTKKEVSIRKRKDHKGKGRNGDDCVEDIDGFLVKVDKFGCPIRPRSVLTGHIGWVNAVTIEDAIIVSGGSDHTVRVWDALSGTLLCLIPNLFTSRVHDLGVFSVSLSLSSNTTTSTNSIISDRQKHRSIIGIGSVIEGYQVHDLKTGEKLLELDEPLTSRQHHGFESEIYQNYASKIAITPTVIVTTSKIPGRLCIWDRDSGELSYRIHICPSIPNDLINFGGMYSFSIYDVDNGHHRNGSKNHREISQDQWEWISSPMVSEIPNRPSQAPTAMGQRVDPPLEAYEDMIHTFKVTKTGSLMLCTLCDGRVATFEFGKVPQKASMNEIRDNIEQR